MKSLQCTVFYGVRHGKGPCDACTGHVKQAMVRLVKSGTSIADTPEAFYAEAKKHLTTENSKPGKCVHFRQTFHFTSKLANRPKVSNLTPIPDTRQLHVVCNSGDVHEVSTRKILCCCTGCLRHEGPCENPQYSDEWQAYNMLTKRKIAPNFSLWSNMLACDVSIRNITWVDQLQEMNFTNFCELEDYVNTNPVPEMEVLNTDDVMMECDKSRIDYVAHHLPTDAPDGYAPVSIFGDGNCFPRTCSYLVAKHQERYTEFRVWIIYELVLHKNMYLNDEYVSKGTSVVRHRGNTVDQIAMFLRTITPCKDYRMKNISSWKFWIYARMVHIWGCGRY